MRKGHVEILRLLACPFALCVLLQQAVNQIVESCDVARHRPMVENEGGLAFDSGRILHGAHSGDIQTVLTRFQGSNSKRAVEFRFPAY